MAPASASQRAGWAVPGSRMVALLTGAFEVRDTAAADALVARVAADVGAPVPAALALGMRARRHRDRDLAGCAAFARRRGRRDEDELQVVAQALQQREVVSGRGEGEL